MSTFGVLRARIISELNRPDLETEAGAAIVSAIAHYAPRKFWFNTAIVAGDPTIAGDSYLDFPAGLITLERDGLYIDAGSGFDALRKESPATLAIWSQGGTTNGNPYAYAEIGGQVQLYPPPAGIYQTQWHGLAALAALEDDDDTNAWLSEAEEVIRQRAKALVRVDVIGHGGAMQEAQTLTLRGGSDGCISSMELSALRALKTQNAKRLSRGRMTLHG